MLVDRYMAFLLLDRGEKEKKKKKKKKIKPQGPEQQIFFFPMDISL